MGLTEIVKTIGIIPTGAGSLAVILTLIQIAPIKINPWTWLAKKIGKAINGEMFEEVYEMQREVKNIRKEMGEDRAVGARVRILRYDEELLDNKRLSKDSFDQALDDTTEYEKYCEDHPNFPNNKTKMAVQNIERVYQKCLAERDFL